MQKYREKFEESLSTIVHEWESFALQVNKKDFPFQMTQSLFQTKLKYDRSSRTMFPLPLGHFTLCTATTMHFH